MKNKTIITTLFIAYILFLFYILIFSRMFCDIGFTYNEWLSTMYNFIPFRNAFDFFTAPVKTLYYALTILKNYLGNIVLFIPMGYFLPTLFKKCRNFKFCVILIVLLILAVEFVQFFSMLGAFDIDDVIMNVLGAIIGFFLFRIIARKRKIIN